MKTYAMTTLGCKVNQYDGETIKGSLAGYRPVEFGENADFHIINSCGVTAEANAKARQLIRRAKRHAPGTVVVLTGCWRLEDKEELRELGVELFVANAEKPRLAAALGALDNPASAAESERMPVALPSRARAFLKVQDGCDQHCSYCAIPTFRGPLWSRPEGEIVNELNYLCSVGFAEVVLTGIHLGKYGVDLDRSPDLGGLITRLLAETPIERLRLSSIEPQEVNDGLIDLLGNEERLAPHLHIPVQSGSDRILKLMNRPYRREDFDALVRRARSARPEVGLTTDVMVGFPTETEADFQQTIELVETSELSKLHTFKFSTRPGTPAAAMNRQVAPTIAKRRASEIGAVGRSLAAGFAQRLVGKTISAVLEPAQGGQQAGLTGEYVRVNFNREVGTGGELISSSALSASDGILTGGERG